MQASRTGNGKPYGNVYDILPIVGANIVRPLVGLRVSRANTSPLEKGDVPKGQGDDPPFGM